MKELEGFLFSKLGRIGSKAEGPDYYLQLFDSTEIPIVKKAHLWQEDPLLQKHLATKVTLSGYFEDNRFQYEKIHAHRLVTVF